MTLNHDRSNYSSEAAKEPVNPAGNPRQTQSYLQNMLDSNGLSPRRRLGQNFLVDLNLLDLLVDSAQLQPNDVVLEIGAGTAGLTSRLAALVKHVVSVEVDPGFFKLASYELRGVENVTLLHADALHNKNRMNELVMKTLDDKVKEHGRADYHLVANLPYDIATCVIGNLLLEQPLVRSMTFTVQYEVGERITAQPGSKDYGGISVLVQATSDAEWIRTLGPTVFWPRPKIDSAILHIVVRPEAVCPRHRLTAFHAFIRDLFSHRRKGTRQALISIPRFKAVKARLDETLAGMHTAFATSRAEQLSATELYRLFEAVDPLVAGN